jgi:hypothetical protein
MERATRMSRFLSFCSKSNRTSCSSYVVLRFASQKFKTPVIKKTLNPVYDEKDATFNVPVYLSIVERIGATVELVLWDKDFIGKDYLGEVSLPLNQWFELNGGVRNYEDKKNTVRCRTPSACSRALIFSAIDVFHGSTIFQKQTRCEGDHTAKNWSRPAGRVHRHVRLR